MLQKSKISDSAQKFTFLTCSRITMIVAFSCHQFLTGGSDKNYRFEFSHNIHIFSKDATEYYRSN